MSKEWTTVCSIQDLIRGAGVCVLFNDEQVAIFQDMKGEHLYALSNFDPFGEANVLSRGIIGSLGEKPVVASPLYKQHFCLESGLCLEDESVSVPSYSIRKEGEYIQLSKP